MSLRYKILAAVIGITVVVLSLVLAVILFELFGTKQEFQAFDEHLRQSTIRWVARNSGGILRTKSSPVRQMPLIRDIVHVQGDDARGTLVIVKDAKDVDEAEVRDLIRRAIEANDGRGVTLSEGNTFAVPDDNPKPGPAQGGTWFRLDLPGFSPHEPLQKVYIVMLVGLVVIVIVIYVVLSRAVIRPIERLERAAKRVAAGDYSKPVPLAGREDEIDTLVATFNGMMVELGNYRHHLEERAEDARSLARAAEKNLIIAQRLGATGKLASGIAHEVNNPLAGMQNAARRLLRDPPAEEAKRIEYLELIIDGLERVKETVKKVLQFTPHQVAPQPVSVETVLRRALALASHRVERDDLDVVVDVPPEALVFGDPFELQQVFLNILINAMDAIAEAGSKGEIRIRSESVDGEIRVGVTDNGTGMSEEQISQAFDLFYTTKEVGEGTGLGLSIAHNVVQNHGGRIDIRSDRGEGTTVEIILPLLEGAAP